MIYVMGKGETLLKDRIWNIWQKFSFEVVQCHAEKVSFVTENWTDTLKC